jgi:hypothetical protein
MGKQRVNKIVLNAIYILYYEDESNRQHFMVNRIIRLFFICISVRQ